MPDARPAHRMGGARASKHEMRDTRNEVIAYIDGGSRGNPGPAAAGFTLTDHAGTQLQAKAFFIGRTTNNVAEYTGIIKALEAAKQIGAERITVFSDSELLVRQLNGKYKVKSELIRPLFRQAVDLLGEFESWKVQHIVREKNRETDKLVNQALNLERDVTDFRLPIADCRLTAKPTVAKFENRKSKIENPTRSGSAC